MPTFILMPPKAPSFPRLRHLPRLALLAVAFALPSLAFGQQGDFSLDSANPEVAWKVRLVTPSDPDGGLALSEPGHGTDGWMRASVPGTVFGSAVEDGLEPDPNYGDNVYRVDRAKYDRDAWYRTEFRVPEGYAGRRVWLNFDGINKAGQIFFNGHALGSLDGFMDRGRYDVTDLIRRDGPNALAVRIQFPTEQPITNRASPTYLSAGGWDWMPYVPGLLTGITDHVWLSASGDVTLMDPWIRTKLADGNARADLALEVELQNHAATPQTGTLAGTIQPGNVQFLKEITLAAGERQIVKLGSAEFPQLSIADPKLWWPNGYGEPDLASCALKFTVGHAVSDETAFPFGIREYSYDTEGGVLHVRINGTRVFLKGGNWGMSEYLLRCRGAEYDLKAALHQDMGLNIIRNWLGSTTDGEFYDACDRHGIMVWDDFWLATAFYPVPDHLASFRSNVEQKIRRRRNHPCIAVWCGENESNPAPILDDLLRDSIATLDGGDRLYQPNSHAGHLSGSGLWTNLPPAGYFIKYPSGYGGDVVGWGLRTEIGTAVFTTFESFKQFMPPEHRWPRDEMWNKHFFGPAGGNAGPDTYQRSIDDRYGKATGIEDFCRKAQLLNIETNKAMYEGWLANMWADASGIMTWMSQSAYPSCVWQTYDYYYDLNGAYWGVKSACEPVHILWNAASNAVQVTNTSRSDWKGLTATATVYNKDGIPAPGYSRSCQLDSHPNTASECFVLPFVDHNLAAGRPAVASSSRPDAGGVEAAVDGNPNTRWGSEYADNQWVYVDLGSPQEIGEVRIHWEGAHAKAYDLQVSDDAKTWRTVYSTEDGKGGMERIKLDSVTTRYVKMNGRRRANALWGFSIVDLQVLPAQVAPSGLSDVHFIKLTLKDEGGAPVSENFYWRGDESLDYRGLNSLPRVDLDVHTEIERVGEDCVVTSRITNPASSPGLAFAVHVQPVKAKDGARLLPAMMNDNYFSLLPGEVKAVRARFRASLLGDDAPKLLVEPYNNR